MLVSDLGLAAMLFPNEDFFIITGSCGKTTTAELVHHILIQENIEHVYGGNMGIPIVGAIMNHKKKAPIIVEASSFQLEWCYTLPIVCASLVSLYPNKHLNMHQTETHYINAKLKIFQHTEKLKRGLMDVNGFYAERSCEKIPLLQKLKTETISYATEFWTYRMDHQQGWIQSYGPLPKKIFPLLFRQGQDLWNEQFSNISGGHNKSNAFSAYGIVELLNVSQDAFFTHLKTFTKPKHRQEFIGVDKNGYLWVNDSKACDFYAAMAAIKNLIWIMGGKTDNIFPGNKNMKILHNLAGVCVYGEVSKNLFQEKIKPIFEDRSIPCIAYENFEDTIEKAYNMTFTIPKNKKQNMILLSPGWQSFDQFKNYQLRGEKFIEIFQDFQQTI